MGQLAVWIIAGVFILMMAVIGLIYTVATLIDMVWRDDE